MRNVLSLLVFMVACKPTEVPTLAVDADGDGFGVDEDCNDDDSLIFPGAPERCDSIDNDCDAEIDEDLLSEYFTDADGDGFGDEGSPILACARPEGAIVAGGDCDDTAAGINPNAIEQCDDIDRNCDGDPRADAVGGEFYWPDTDGDGFGDPGQTQRFCVAPAGFLEADSGPADCDDTDSGVNPAAAEVCATPFDDDCDGNVNETPVADGVLLPVDLDGDGVGSVVTESCGPNTLVDLDGDQIFDGITVAEAEGGDCNDADAGVFPGADEICDGLDNDCNAATPEDEFAVDTRTWFRDVDEDGAGDDSDQVTACEQPVGFVPSNIAVDCNDGDATVGPGQGELCDGFDNNCDGDVDESTASDADLYYPDLDSDGLGDAFGIGIPSCSPIVGLSENNFDCDDDDDMIGSAGNQYIDEDMDGFGDPLGATQACFLSPGLVDNADDCDDTNADINPDTIWYQDSDGDGFGNDTTTLMQCLQPDGFVAENTDCVDSDPNTNPGILEDLCDGVDNDCDGTEDDDCFIEHCGPLTTAETWAADKVHRVTCDVSVQGSGISLTIADGTTVEFAEGTAIRVGTVLPGTLFVAGTGLGVQMIPATDGTGGPWKGIELGQASGGSTGNFISGATITGAGATGQAIEIDDSEALVENTVIVDSFGAGILVTGEGQLELVASSITGSEGFGVDVEAGASLIALEENLIADNDADPLRMPFTDLAAFDDSNEFSEDGLDRVVLLGETVSADLIVPNRGIDYLVDGDVSVQGGGAPLLTIEDGVSLFFSEDSSIRIGQSAAGLISVEGDSEGVAMHGEVAVPGHWEGVYVGEEGEGDFEGLDIRHGGANGQANLWIEADTGVAPEERGFSTVMDVSSSASSHSGISVRGARLTILDSDLSSNATHGAELIDLVEVGTMVVDTTFSDNGGSGTRLSPQLVPKLELSNAFSGNELPIEVIAGFVVDDAVWGALSEPYYISGDVFVADSESPMLTIAAGVEAYFGENGGLYCGSGGQGSIIIDGSGPDSVLFSALTEYLGDPSVPGSYVGIGIGDQNVESRISGLTMRYAGAESAALSISGDQGTVLEVEDTTIQYSGAIGIRASAADIWVHDSNILDGDDVGLSLEAGARLFRQGGATRSFTDNVISGNGDIAITLPSDSVGQLDDSSSYTGNSLVVGGPDRVSIYGPVTTPNQRWSALGANFWLDSGDVVVGGQSSPVVTMEPGVVVEVEAQSDTRFEVGPNGTPGGLVAIGSEDDRVVFTSDEAWRDNAVPGDWGALYLGPDCLQVNAGQANCVLEYVTVDYAGADNDQAALIITERDPIPVLQPVIAQHLLVRNSGSSGLQLQVDGSVYGVDVTPDLPFPFFLVPDEDDPNILLRADLTYVCEGDVTTGACTVSDLCWSGSAFGSTNLYCDNTDANVSTRNFESVFIYRSCATVGLDDGPQACP